MFARLLLKQDLDPGGRLVQAHSEILDLAGQTFPLSFQHGRLLLRPDPLLPLLLELRPEPRGEGPDLRDPSFPFLKFLCAKSRLPAAVFKARLEARVLVLQQDQFLPFDPTLLRNLSPDLPGLFLEGLPEPPKKVSRKLRSLFRGRRAGARLPHETADGAEACSWGIHD